MKCFFVLNKTSQILTLCFVGLNPDSLNLLIKSVFIFIVLYNNSKLFRILYYINKSSIKGSSNL